MTAADEQQLILRVKDGSHEAFRVLVERHMKEVYNIAYSFVNDHDDAEDVAQESFVRVFQSIHKFRGDSLFSTWLYRIVANMSLNRLREHKGKRLRETPASLADGPSPVGDGPDSSPQEIRAAVERAIHELPTMQRAVVILRHLDGLSTKQVSSILSCSHGTVKTQLHRALKKVRLSMESLAAELR